MSIKPSSDLLLDVARAADPARSSAATERLARIAAGSGAGDNDFADVLDGVEMPAPALAPVGSDTAPSFAADKPPMPSAAPSQPEVQAYQGIEALLLQNLVETMLPESEEFFGSGAGAGIWKSMLAQELGTALSKRVDLGIGPKHTARWPRAHAGGELGASLALGPVIPKHS